MAERILVTGGAGFIGSHIVRRLVAEGAEVRVVDDLSTGMIDRVRDCADSIDFIRGDLTDKDVSDRVVEGVHYVIHQAAIPSVQRSIANPLATNRSNITATLNLLEGSCHAGVRRLVYAASSSAYGNAQALPKTETMCPDPLSPYALQKFVGERYCKLYNDLYGLETVSLRYFNVFGPGQDPSSEYSAVIPKFISAISAGKPLTVYGDGEQSRDFTFVENVVEANLLALRAKQAPGNVCNVGCGERITLNALIHSLEEILGKKAEVTYASPRLGDVRHSLADLTLARRLLDYEPKIMVKEGLKRTIEALLTAP